MKVLFVIQKLQLRGAEIFACQLAGELNSTGTITDIAYLFRGEATLKKQFSHLNFISIGGDIRKRLGDFRAYRKISQIIIKGDYDIVQANAADTLKYTVLSKRIFRWKQPLVYRNAGKMGAFLKSSVHRMINKWLLKSCNYIISVSENTRQDLIDIYPQARQNSITITIGTYAFSDILPYQKDVPADEPVFINLASLVPEKNHAFLIQIFEKYFKIYRRGYLWIVGDGILRKTLEEQIMEIGMQDRIRFWGYRADVISLLKGSDALVLPSLIEGMPAVILEAMICNVPVITSNVGGIPEIVVDNVTGLCLKNFDHDDYVTAMQTIVNDLPFRKSLVMNANKLVSEKFMMNQISEQFINVYQKIHRDYALLHGV